MKIKIVSDGTPMGTTVVDSETGEPLHGVTSVSWIMKDCDSLGSAVLTFEKVPCEVTGEVE